MISIIDTSALITFYQLDIIQLLNQLFNEVYIPDTVERQFLKRETDTRLRFLFSFYEENKWFRKCQTYEPAMMKILSTDKRIDEGEREAMAQYKRIQTDLGIEEGNIVCVIDERIGRRVAGNMDIKVMGTLYLLARLGILGMLDYHRIVGDIRLSRRFSKEYIDEAHRRAKEDFGI